MMIKILFGLCVAGAIVGVVAIIQTFLGGQIVTNASDRVPWGMDEPFYIFFSGISAGSYVVSVLWLFGFRRFKSVARIAVLQAMVLIAVGPLFLLVAMGRPERFYLLFFSPNPTSVIAWGAYLLVIYQVLCLIYGYHLIRRDMGTPLSAETVARHDKRARFWGLLGLPAAIFVHGYTGVLLGFVYGRPLWHSALMPVLFLTSAFLSGVALLILILALINRWTRHKTDPGVVQALTRLMFFLLLLDTFFLASEFLTGTYMRGSEHFEAWMVLFRGLGGWMFVGVEVFLGIVLPVVLLSRRTQTQVSVLMASGLILLGVFAMRCNLILGGQVIQTYGGPEGSYFPSLHEWLVALGLVSLGGILYLLGGRFLPLVPKEKLGDEQLEGVAS